MRIAALCTLLLPILGGESEATPQLARQYQRDCTTCHAGPPRLNQTGLDFVARGYRFDEPQAIASHKTVPLAVWNTFDLERRHSADLTKAFPSRVEVISVGVVPGTRLSYFAEWRALSQSIAGNGRLLDRSGRFEDLFLKIPLRSDGAFAVTAGQFRALSQVDVSLRLGISEPLALSSGLPGERASTARLTSLRSFSPSGRQPGLRVEYQRATAGRAADGWFSAMTLPLTGELTIPLTEAASFELEGRPKGVFVESYRRRGLSSLGGHAFVGDDRRMASFVMTHDFGDRVALFGALGVFSALGATDARTSVGGEVTLTPNVVGGVRLDDRSARGQRAALLLYGNGHLPLGPPRFRQALRLQIEQRVQPRNHVTSIALSHIF